MNSNKEGPGNEKNRGGERFHAFAWGRSPPSPLTLSRLREAAGEGRRYSAKRAVERVWRQGVSGAHLDVALRGAQPPVSHCRATHGI